jgi:hypothetical protein
MKAGNILMIVAIVAVIASLVATGITLFSIVNLSARISGFAATTGTANLTVESSASVNFTTDTVDWGSGRLDPGVTGANLFTVGAGSVNGGNWTAKSGLILENIGNTNVTLNLSGAKTASTFIGGTNAVYKFNVSDNEASSCLNTSGGQMFAEGLGFNDVHTTVNYTYCDPFVYHAAQDTIRIDFNVTIPEDSSTGALGDVITATVYT